MLQAARALAGRSGRFMLCAPSANLRSLLKVDQLLEIHDTRAAALSALQGAADTDG